MLVPMYIVAIPLAYMVVRRSNEVVSLMSVDSVDSVY